MIDARAVIHPSAELDSDVQIEPYAIIGAQVQIGAGTWIGSHAVIKGPTRIGKHNRIYQFTSLGEIPQDKKYQGEPNTFLEIGDGNEIREYCTMNRGTVQGGGVTRVGNDNWIMAYSHIAHDCRVGNHTIFANGVTLAGHVCIEDYVALGGFTLVRQFCTVGMHSFTGGNTLVVKDIPPFLIVWGSHTSNRATPHGINKEGLRRRGFSEEIIQSLVEAYKTLYKRNLTTEQAIAALTEQTHNCPEISYLIKFLQHSTQGITR